MELEIMSFTNIVDFKGNINALGSEILQVITNNG